MGPRTNRASVVRRTLPLTMLIACTAMSTGTVLASDACKISLVQTLTLASQAAQRRVTTRHKHSQETLAAWEQWGNAYLAKHGHPYAPPKTKYRKPKPKSPGEQERLFKFACDFPPLPTLDLPVTGFLESPDLLPPESGAPYLTAALQPPPEVAPPSQTGAGGFPGSPIFFPPFGGPGDLPIGGIEIPPIVPPVTPPVTPPGTPPVTPPVTPPDTPPVIPPDVPPVGVVPEPGSFVLLGTGLAAMWASHKRWLRA